MSKSCRTNTAQYDRWATSIDRYHQQQYANWFRKFNWSWYVTLTFDRELGLAEARALLERYLRELEVRSADTLSCLIVMEQKHYPGLGMPAGRVHFHMLVATKAELTAEVFKDYWERLPYGGNRTKKQGPSAHVLPSDPPLIATYTLST